jgi:hypothetical protein
MCDQFETWIAIQPLIEKNRDLMKNIRHCFDHKYDGRKLDEGINVIESRSRNIYTGFGSVVDPITDDHLNLALKLGILDNCGIVRVGHPYLTFELGALEQYDPNIKGLHFKRPEFMGIFRNPRLGVDGILTVDLTANGKYDLVPLNNIANCNDGDFVARINKKTHRRDDTYLVDGKRKSNPEFEQIGRKYFRSPNFTVL